MSYSKKITHLDRNILLIFDK
ncbi:hypothetical protein ACQ27_gp373 [Klebsiella phage K64-1]|nr:hypothetical protein ACQ27_gp373 [Klebsiella phage K64-1]